MRNIYDRGDIYFSFIYLLCVICFILPPKEIASAGLTIQNIFSSYLGSEQMDFIGYHLKRTSLTVLIHSFLPIIYYIGLAVVQNDVRYFLPHVMDPLEAVFALVCLTVFISGLFVFFFWKSFNWKFHPLVKDLSKYSNDWQNVASQINSEFRSIYKFSSVSGGTSTYVTDSWIMKTTAYKIYIAQQTDAHLNIEESNELEYNVDTAQSAQYLRIKVITIPPHETQFYLHLNALEYGDLKDRVNAPLLNAKNIVIHQSLNERFIQAFRDQIKENGSVELPLSVSESLEKCIGCMEKTAEIKLLKSCETSSSGECTQCYCRPMWCLECMARWFSSRQDQSQPETWMSSRSPCPTCRSKFCMLDVFTVK